MGKALIPPFVVLPVLIHMKLNETTTNRAGGESFEPENPERQLYKLTVNNLLEDSYYRDDTDAFDELLTAAAHADPEFVVKMAAYAREELYLRDVAIVLLVWASRHDPAKEYVREYGPTVMQRADEPMKALGAHEILFGPPTFERRANKWVDDAGAVTTGLNVSRIRQALENGENVKEVAKDAGVYQSIRLEGVCPSKPLKGAIEDALHNFDMYEVSKYDSDRRAYNMKDVLNIVRPNPRDDLRSEIFERVALGSRDPDVEPLDPPETWEVVISEKGNTREAWEEVLPRMGLFARIRNIRNMLEAGVPAESIIREDDTEYVSNSKIYPFRFYQAYRNSPENRAIREWLMELTSESLGHIDMPDSYVCVDVSGSMSHPVSGQSNLNCKDIASFFGAVMSYTARDVVVFADDAQPVEFQSNNVFDRTEDIRSVNVGGSTNGWKAIDMLAGYREPPARVIMLTDMQIWDSTTLRVNRSVRKSYEALNMSPELYTVDLQSYGDLMFPEGTNNVHQISGWNEKIIDYIRNVEKDDPLEEVWQFEP